MDVTVCLTWEGYALAKSVVFLKRLLECNCVNQCSNSPFFVDISLINAYKQLPANALC